MDEVTYKAYLQTMKNNNILCHESVPKEYEWVEGFISLEVQRRISEMVSITSDLASFEKQYFGVEVGNIRRYFEREMIKHIQPVEEFLDYGCGGGWWKEGYWNIPKHVTGVDVNPEVLLSCRRAYKDPARYGLVYAPYGVTEFRNNTFDTILSSSVLGYILPSLAAIHVREVFRLLKPGGIAIFSRIKAANIAIYMLQRKFREIKPGAFIYAYSLKELKKLLEGGGLEILEAKTMGLALPFGMRLLQFLYGYGLMSGFDKVANKLFPLLSVHHLVVATKR